MSGIFPVSNYSKRFTQAVKYYSQKKPPINTEESIMKILKAENETVTWKTETTFVEKIKKYFEKITQPRYCESGGGSN